MFANCPAQTTSLIYKFRGGGGGNLPKNFLARESGGPGELFDEKKEFENLVTLSL
jgi:hypothetical protein